MTLSTQERTFLQRLVRDRPTERKASGAASFFCEHYRIGTPVHGRVLYAEQDLLSAEQLLRAHRLPVQAPGPDARRADVAIYGGMSEKSQSRAPHADTVAVKPFGYVSLDSRPLFAPRGGYCALTVQDACAARCAVLLVVENLETFRFLEDYAWLPFEGKAVLAVYRGDNLFSAADSAAVLSRRAEPVWGFFDFDPAGLGMTTSVPRLERLLLPDEAWLQQVCKKSHGQWLFDRSRGKWEGILAAVTEPAIAAAWARMKSWRGGASQEVMRDAPAERTKN